jgi:dihydroxyacetone kinase phosphoprotein-dependent L subunit
MAARDATIARLCLDKALEAILASEEELGRLDAVAGDGDHGVGMARGFRAATNAAATTGESAGQVLIQAGAAFSDAAGGASGALYGMWLTAIGQSLQSAKEFDATTLHRAFEAGLATLLRLGRVQPGDKTMIDTLEPFTRAFGDAAARGTTLLEAWKEALSAAERGADSTAEMVSKKGRASRLGERSRGFRDPGAVSMLIVLQAANEALSEEKRQS